MVKKNATDFFKAISGPEEIRYRQMLNDIRGKDTIYASLRAHQFRFSEKKLSAESILLG